MLGNNKTGKFLLAGLAAYAWYKYSRMTAEDKSKMTNDIKEKGRKMYDQYVPKELKNMFEKKNNHHAYHDETGY